MPILYVKVQYKIWILSDVGDVPTPTFQRCWHCDTHDSLHTDLQITFKQNPKLIISFLKQLQHDLLPSVIVTSSQVRVSMSLPLLSCCISGLGPEGLRHNRTIPVVSPSTTQGDPCNFLGETLPPRNFHAKLNGQSAVSTRRPTTSQHPVEKQVTSSRTYKNRIFFGSRVMRFSRDPSCYSTGSYVPFPQGSHLQKQYHQRTTLRT